MEDEVRLQKIINHFVTLDRKNSFCGLGWSLKNEGEYNFDIGFLAASSGGCLSFSKFKHTYVYYVILLPHTHLFYVNDS